MGIPTIEGTRFHNRGVVCIWIVLCQIFFYTQGSIWQIKPQSYHPCMVARKYYVAFNISIIFLFLAWLQKYILLMSLFMSLSYHGFTFSIIAMDLMIYFYSSMCTGLVRMKHLGEQRTFYLPGLFKLLHKCNPSSFAFFLFKLNWPSYMFSHI
jgi:hypothetical protein